MFPYFFSTNVNVMHSLFSDFGIKKETDIEKLTETDQKILCLCIMAGDCLQNEENQ